MSRFFSWNNQNKEPLLEATNNEHYFGIENCGNTCYASAVLQALFFCSPFRACCLNYDYPASTVSLLKLKFIEKGVSDQDSLFSHLRNFYTRINTQKKKTGVISPILFINKLRSENGLFS